MSYRKLYLGIDLGSTSVKALLLNEDSEPVGQGFCEYKTYFPRPLWAEQDPREWWSATKRVIVTLQERYLRPGDRICGISVSSQAPALVGIDADGNPVGRGLTWQDRRATGLCAEYLASRKDAILAASGNELDPYYVLAKLVWLKQNQPNELERIASLLQVNGYIIYQLTGKATVDSVHAPLTQMYDIRQKRWNTKLLRELGLPVDILPTVYPCRSVVGSVLPTVAAELGLNADIPVAAGCTDGASSAYGLGLNRPGLLFEMSGQSSGIGLISDKAESCPPLCLIKHSLADLWIVKGSMSSTGGSMKWFRDQVEQRPENAETYHALDHLAEESIPGAHGLLFLPYLSGERAPLWDSAARGVYFGISGSTTKADMVRAIMEGTAFGLLSIYRALPQEQLAASVIYGTGGGYRSQVWSQIKADVLGKEIAVRALEFDAAAIGSAYIAMEAATGTLCPKNIDEQKIERIYTPDPGHTARYQDIYGIFHDLYYANKALFARNFALQVKS